MEHLTLSFIAEDYKIAISEILFAAYKHKCHVQESRLTTLGMNFFGIMHLSGNWSHIAKLEQALSAYTQGSNPALNIQIKRNKSLKLTGDFLPYIAQVIALDTPGLVYQIAHFFSQQDIYIIDLQSDPFKTSHTETMMLTMVLRLNIPAATNISNLRENFMILCDELNIDGIIEPEKR